MLRVALERQALKRTLALPETLCGSLGRYLGEAKDQAMLDPRLRLLLAANRTRKPLNEHDVAGARNLYAEMMQLTGPEAPTSITCHDYFMPANGDNILLRSYYPDASRHTAAMPGLLFLHGGGFTIGSVDTYHQVVAWLAEQMGVVLVSVDYRLGPEHPYPAAAEDGIAAWQWLCANTDRLGLNPDRLGVMGDSAGGNLAAVISQQAARRGLPSPVIQCLLYPTTDLRMTGNSISRYGSGYGLTRELIKWFRRHYLADISQANDVLASPGLADKLAGQPNTLLVTATDPLRDEGLAYAETLSEAGTSVTHLDFPQLVHGFIGFGGVLPTARRALEEICQHLSEQL